MELPPVVKCTAYALATYVNGDGSNAHPGVELLMKATGSSRSSVLRALEILQELELVIVVSKGGGKGVARGTASIYQLTVPGGRHRARPGVTQTPGQKPEP
jgi:hypothetical protein